MFNLIVGHGLGYPDNAGILAFGLGHTFFIAEEIVVPRTVIEGKLHFVITKRNKMGTSRKWRLGRW